MAYLECNMRKIKINSILIANRGEIASRIIRTCSKMGIRSIAVYSDSDKHSRFVSQADISYYIGESNPEDSYLNQDIIIRAARELKADAIHPGYGFLSENIEFAKRCKKEKIIFIGPSPESIEAMASKANAKKLMAKNNVPIIPGYNNKDQSIKTFRNEAKKIGFPILIKASSGGGGKGMRIVNDLSEFDSSIDSAKREAMKSFSDDHLILEKYISSARHIEFQIMGDNFGNIIHLFERECSIQRRYQKVIEESPSPVLDNKTRSLMAKVAINAAKAINYNNAGTVEFIFDEKTKDFYFLEVNTRLQVEHVVTEAITNLDLVKMQIEISMGVSIELKQDDIITNGYAIQCRLYAENPKDNFSPQTGKIVKFLYPEIEGLRMESSVEDNSMISVYYDPMIAKIIVWGKNRDEAHSKMNYMLNNLVCLGVKTNQSLLLNIINNKDFQDGKYDTHFIQNKLHILERVQDKIKIIAIIASSIFSWCNRNKKRNLLRALPSGWRNNFYDFEKEKYSIDDIEIDCKYRYLGKEFNYIVSNNSYNVSIVNLYNDTLLIEVDSILYKFIIVKINNDLYIHNEELGNEKVVVESKFPEKSKDKIIGGYESPMPSQIIKILVKVGDKINEGDELLILSSMKMESSIIANKSGIVKDIFVKEGENVEAGYLLLKVE